MTPAKTPIVRVRVGARKRPLDSAKVAELAESIAQARRNLTDEQRTLVLGRYYNTLKLAPYRPSTEKEVKFTSFSGHNATSRYVGDMFGVSEKTVRNAIKGGDQR